MRRSIFSSQTSSLSELSSYYRQCLALERQGESVFGDNALFEQTRFPPRFFPVTPFAYSWDDLLTTKAAQDAADLAR